MALTQERVLAFLLERGGKVKNSELLNNFKGHINCSDPAEKQHNRELFKKLVNSVAVVRHFDEVKFVVVKKRYQDFVKETTRDDGGGDDPQRTRESFPALRFSFTSPRRPQSAEMLCSDVENNNACQPAHMGGSHHGDDRRATLGSTRGARRGRVTSQDTTVKVLNISADQVSRAGRSGAVFAVIAVKSPPRASAPAAQGGAQTPRRKPLEKSVTSNLDSYFPACKKDARSDSQCCKSKEASGVQAPVLPHAKPHNKTTRQGEDASKYSECVPLEPLAHEWLVKCAAGLWGQIYALLLQDARLAQRKDFMSGFTALHWAAKDGNGEMIQKLMDVSRKRGADLDVDSKAHGGYTPLHVAAIHGHAEVVRLLVQRYGASVSERDNHGKKAHHYLGRGVSAEVRALVGGLQQGESRERTEDEDSRDQPKGFNTISKLFQPHMGKKQKHAARFAHDW